MRKIVFIAVMIPPVLFSTALFLQARSVDLGRITVRTVRVEKILPELLEDGSLRLTAELSEQVEPPCQVVWRFRGETHSYEFLSDQGRSAALAMGDRRAEVTVEACLSQGERLGGCAALTLTADLLDQAQDAAAWLEIHAPDLTEPGFLCRVLEDDQYQYVFYEVASRISTVTGEYILDNEDLSVNVPGGKVSVHRWYQGGRWRWEHERHDLKRISGPGGGLKAVEKGGTVYRAVKHEKGLFSDGVYQIQETDSGFRWESGDGEWKRYNPEGRLIAFGDGNGVIGRVLFRNGRPFCLSDRDNRPVLWLEYDDSGLLRSAYDLNGRGVTYRYRQGRLSSVTNVLGRETRFSYDPRGLLSETIGPEEEVTRIAYDKLGRVTSVRDAEGEGHSFDWEFDQKSSLYHCRVQEPSGRVVEIWFNKKGRAERVDVNGNTVRRMERVGSTLAVTDARGLTTCKTFDSRENLLQAVYPDGSTLKLDYHPRFNLPTKKINENGMITLFTYDQRGNLIRKVEAAETPVQRTTEYTYDRSGYLTAVRRLSHDHTTEALTRYTYDSAGNRASKIDPEGNITRYAYDPSGNLISRTDPDGAVHEFSYDSAGRLTRRVDPLGHATEYAYDAHGRKISEIDPMGNETRYTYDSKGNLIGRTDALGNTHKFEYNASGEVTRRIDPEGKETRFVYDDQGRLVSTIDGAGNETRLTYENPAVPGCPECNAAGSEQERPWKIIHPTYETIFTYDARGRKIKETDFSPETGELTTRFAYDPVGNLVSRTDRKGRTTEYVYDALNRLIKIIDPLGNETAYSYDSRDNLIALTDANGNTTRFTYNRKDLLVKEIRPMGQEITYSYDASGRLKKKIDAEGRKSVRQYDAAGHLSSIRYYPPSKPGGPVGKTSFTYDKAGNLISYNDGITSASYTYDAINRKTNETIDYGPFTKTFTYSYYKNGLKKQLTAPNNITYHYTYDQANRLTSIEIPDLGLITYSDYQWNSPRKAVYPKGTVRTFDYDPFMRVKRILSSTPKGPPLLDYRYTRDPMGNITSIQTEHGDYTYSYDALDRLSRAINPTLQDESFTYDPAGNRIKSAHAKTKWHYNQNNELTAYNGVSFIYDKDGNTIKKAAPNGTTRYFYNIQGRMARSTTESGTSASYYYDPFGRRLYKKTTNKKEYFLYSDEGLLAEFNDKGKEIKTYGYAPNSTWTTNPLFIMQDNRYYFFHNDHLGTPHKITAPDGTLTWSAQYTSFGKAKVAPDSTITNHLRFPGQYHDPETCLHYNFHRYYNPTVGRYLTQDPLKQKDDTNLFLYVSNNVPNIMDPFGLYREIGGGFGITAGLISISLSVHTDICCDAEGKKHIRTIQSSCIGIEIGLGLKETYGARATISDDKRPGKCEDLDSAKGWYSEDSGVWGALGIGRSYSTLTGTGWKIGFGGGWDVYSGCRHNVINDVISGNCCKLN